MSFIDFVSKQMIKVLDTDEETPVGNSIIFSESTELKHCRIIFYKHGFGFTGNERLFLKLYSDQQRSKLVYQSQPLITYKIINPDIATTEYWLGKVRFDFEPAVSILAGDVYYASISISNYIRNKSNYYIGIGFESPKPVNVIDANNPPFLL